LVRLARNEVPVNGVFAIDVEERYPSSLFMPQQMVVWPGGTEGLLDAEDQLFAPYFKHYRKTMAAYGQQPLFNDRETRQERLSFLSDLGVTHVLVNPRLYRLMSGVLSRDPQLFRRRYDDGEWALYEVLR
jgi:hypothetical protein